MATLPINPFEPIAPDVEEVARLVEPSMVTEEEVVFDTSLRPKKLDEFIGQDGIKENVRILIEAAKARGETMDHVLLYGPPGLGKTTLAHIMASEAGANIRVTSGPALSRVGDLAAVLTNLQKGDILFIDEIHRMNKAIEEVLYPAMEDYALDIIVGKGPSARTIRLNLERFTLIGATTRVSLLSSPLRDRFGAVYHLELYSPEQMTNIVARSTTLLNVTADTAATQAIANRARSTPRIANRLLKRVRDFAQVKHNTSHISEPIAMTALDTLLVDQHGMDAVDRRILRTIVDTFQGGPVGLNTLAAATGEEEQTIEEVYEPFLLQRGFIQRTSRGRTATERAFDYFGIAYDPR